MRKGADRAERHRALPFHCWRCASPESHVRSEPCVGIDATVLEGKVCPAIERIGRRSVISDDIRSGGCTVGTVAQRGAAAGVSSLNATVVVMLQVQHAANKWTGTRQH